MPEEPSEPKRSVLRPRSVRFAESQRADFGPDDEPPRGAHPKIVQIVRHWRGLRPALGRLPGRQHFDPVDVPRLLRNIWLVDVVEDDPRLFRARLVGTAFEQLGARLRKGKFFEDVAPAAEAEVTTSAFRHVLRAKCLNWRRGPSSLSHMEHVRELERVIMPLATDGETVDMFLCLTVFYMADGTDV